MGGDLIGSESNDRKVLVDLHSILLLITCLHYTLCLSELEGKESRIKGCRKHQLCLPCPILRERFLVVIVEVELLY